MTYEEKRKRYRLIREINAKIKREKLERYANLRAKYWEKV